LGAETVSASDQRWLSPLPLWTGLLAGPLVWAADLTISYALVQWTCSSQRGLILHLISPVSFALVTSGGLISRLAFRQTGADLPTDAGDPRARARFMAILGLTSSALFALTIVAGAIPRWILDACQ
jgi:hypothetical protein